MLRGSYRSVTCYCGKFVSVILSYFYLIEDAADFIALFQSDERNQCKISDLLLPFSCNKYLQKLKKKLICEWVGLNLSIYSPHLKALSFHDFY